MEHSFECLILLLKGISILRDTYPNFLTVVISFVFGLCIINELKNN